MGDTSIREIDFHGNDPHPSRAESIRDLLKAATSVLEALAIRRFDDRTFMTGTFPRIPSCGAKAHPDRVAIRRVASEEITSTVASKS